MVYQGCDEEYAAQVTAEHKILVKNGNAKPRLEWVPKHSHADNHFLDCEVYAMCAADMIGARTFHLQEVEVQARTEAKPDPDPAFTPEENWITQNENWLGG